MSNWTERPIPPVASNIRMELESGGEEVIKAPAATRFTAVLIPGSGATTDLYWTASPFSMIDAETAEWNEISGGGVTSKTSKTFDGGITGFKGTSASGTSAIEIVAVGR